MYIQVMTEAEAEQLSHDPFDITKVWTRKDFPLIEVSACSTLSNLFSLLESGKTYV